MNSEIKSDVKSVRNEKCPICGSDQVKAELAAPDFYVSKGNSELFQVKFCSECQLGISFPKMEYAQLSRYYPSDYIPYQPRRGVMGWLRSLKFNGDRKIILAAKSDLKTCFEIGAGSGEFLSFLKNSGLNVSGLEQSHDGCKTAYEIFNIDLKTDNAESYSFTESYDCIVARYVLEHLNDPIKVLSNIYNDGLSHQGVLFLKLPRYDSWEKEIWLNHWLGLDLPRHRIHFTANGISRMLSQIGYKEIRIYDDHVPFDFIRSFKYSRISTNHPGFKMSYSSSLRALIASIVSFVVGRKRSGRMAVVAKKI